ncbi:MAG: hypothetical protein L0H84_22640, partial [Pseudonocardia sp.]|nr:hypothetical protein [Pseudonocardia sp.]
RRYEWTDPAPVAVAPEWLAGLLQRTPTLSLARPGVLSAAAMAGLVRTAATAPTGRRNAALYWAARRATERGGDLTPIVDAAIGNGLSRREAEATARSAHRAARQGATG